MIEEYVTIGTIHQGKLDLPQRADLAKALGSFADGDVEVCIRTLRHQRSHAQNRYWHGIVIPLFAEHCGYDVREMKRVLALELLPVTVRKMDGTEVTVPGHTADLTVPQFNDLIERAQRLGAEMEIYIPDPNEVAA